MKFMSETQILCVRLALHGAGLELFLLFPLPSVHTSVYCYT